MQSQKLLSFGAAALAVTAIAGGSLLFRDGSDSTASALGLTDGQLNQIAADVSATAEADREAYLQKIADNLGVDIAKLKEAIGKANVDTLAEKVASGAITQERADAMRGKLATGDTFFVGGRGPGGPGGHGGPGGIGFGKASDELATFFGIDAATLRTELQTKSLATIATEHGKTVEQLKAFMVGQAQAQLAERVAAGDMTQAEADAKLAEMQTRLDEEINEVHASGEKGPRGLRPEGAAPVAPGQ